jgi:hypothetical protein
MQMRKCTSYLPVVLSQQHRDRGVLNQQFYVDVNVDVKNVV